MFCRKSCQIGFRNYKYCNLREDWKTACKQKWKKGPLCGSRIRWSHCVGIWYFNQSVVNSLFLKINDGNLVFGKIVAADVGFEMALLSKQSASSVNHRHRVVPNAWVQSMERAWLYRMASAIFRKLLLTTKLTYIMYNGAALCRFF